MQCEDWGIGLFIYLLPELTDKRHIIAILFVLFIKRHAHCALRRFCRICIFTIISTKGDMSIRCQNRYGGLQIYLLAGLTSQSSVSVVCALFSLKLILRKRNTRLLRVRILYILHSNDSSTRRCKNWFCFCCSESSLYIKGSSISANIYFLAGLMNTVFITVLSALFFARYSQLCNTDFAELEPSLVYKQMVPEPCSD